MNLTLNFIKINNIDIRENMYIKNKFKTDSDYFKKQNIIIRLEI